MREEVEFGCHLERARDHEVAYSQFLQSNSGPASGRRIRLRIQLSMWLFAHDTFALHDWSMVRPPSSRLLGGDEWPYVSLLSHPLSGQQ